VLRPAVPQWSGAIATFKPQPASLSGSLALGGTAANNYTLYGASGSATINPLPLIVTAVPETKTYDGTTSATGSPTVGTGAIQPGDTAPVWTQAFLSSHACATNGATLSPSVGVVNDSNGGNNYTYNYITASGTINPAPASVTLGSLVHTYDGTPKAATATTSPAGKSVGFSYSPSDPPVNAGSYVVVATITDSNFTGTASGTLVINPDGIHLWRSAHFTPDEITAGLAADNADADGDGLSNLDEYTLGSDPRNFSPQPLTLTRVGDHFTLSFFARAAAGAGYAGLTRVYEVQGSSDLTNWQTSGSEIVGSEQTVTLDTAVPQFYRLRVRLE